MLLHQSKLNWDLMFYLELKIYVGFLFFLMIGSTIKADRTKQPRNMIKKDKEAENIRPLEITTPARTIVTPTKGIAYFL